MATDYTEYAVPRPFLSKYVLSVYLSIIHLTIKIALQDPPLVLGSVLSELDLSPHCIIRELCPSRSVTFPL